MTSLQGLVTIMKKINSILSQPGASNGADLTDVNCSIVFVNGCNVSIEARRANEELVALAPTPKQRCDAELSRRKIDSVVQAFKVCGKGAWWETLEAPLSEAQQALASCLEEGWPKWAEANSQVLEDVMTHTMRTKTEALEKAVENLSELRTQAWKESLTDESSVADVKALATTTILNSEITADIEKKFRECEDVSRSTFVPLLSDFYIFAISHFGGPGSLCPMRPAVGQPW